MKSSLLFGKLISGLTLLVFAQTALAGGSSLLATLEEEIVGIVDESSPAVVSVTTESLPPIWCRYLDEGEIPVCLKDFLKSDFAVQKRSSNGSGFIIDPEGHILTTEHVVRNARDVMVTLADGRVLPARVVGRDGLFNIALLKVEGKDLPSLPLADSEGVRVGSWVIALGRPYGLATSPSWGIVSGLARSDLGIAPYEEMIQITAPVNPGDSGGPVLNAKGEVIGVITGSFAGYREFEFDWPFIRRFQKAFPRVRGISPDHFFLPSQAQGIGFATPINLAKKVMADLRRSPSPSRGWLGIEIGYSGAGVTIGEEKAGVLVASVLPSSPASRAGLQENDIILALDGVPVGSPRQLQKTILFSPAGEPVKLELIRGGERRTISAVLGEQEVDGKGE